MEMNPVASVRDPKYSVRKGKTLSGNRLASCWISIDPGILVGKRDGTLIALITYTFARVSAATYGIKLRGQEKR